MNYILTAERLGIEKSMWGFGTFHSVARQLLCKYLPEKCTVEGTDRAVNQNETTDWNREFEVIESEEEMQMLLDLADANGYKIKYKNRLQAEILEKVFERAELPVTFSNVGKEGEVIHFMTLHASKGLEFDYVFIVGLNQGLIPLRCTGMEQEEEEMRLFFVGLTRARKNLELSYYTNPIIPGVFEAPSRYLKRLPEHLLDWEEKPGSEERKANLQSLRRQAVETIRRKSAEKNMAETEPVKQEERHTETESVKQEERHTETESVKQEERHTNTEERVVRRGRHPKYGEGIITSEDDMTIEVEFPGYGKKQFLKAFGEIEVL